MCCYRKTRTSDIAEHTRAFLVPEKLQSHCWRNGGWSLALGRGTIMYSSCRCKASKETKQSLGKRCKNSQQTLTWWRQGCVHLVDPNNIHLSLFWACFNQKFLLFCDRDVFDVSCDKMKMSLKWWEAKISAPLPLNFAAPAVLCYYQLHYCNFTGSLDVQHLVCEGYKHRCSYSTNLIS